LRNSPSDTLLSSPLRRRSRRQQNTTATLRLSSMSLEDSSRDSTRTEVVTSKMRKSLDSLLPPMPRWVCLTSPPLRMTSESGSRWPTPTVMVPSLSRSTRISSLSPFKRLVSRSKKILWFSEYFSIYFILYGHLDKLFFQAH